MSDETAPGPDLRQMIVNTIISATHIPGSSDCDCEPALVIEASLMEGNRIIDVEATPEVLADAAMVAVRHELDRRDAEIKQLLAQLPSDGKGRWRQGTKNPRNLYVHQGDDETGQPVGQLYSAELAALVCDAVNAQQARGEA